MTIVAFDDAVEVSLPSLAGHDADQPMPRVETFFGDLGDDGDGPQGVMASLFAPTTVGAHFHRVDQFQVFLGEPGSWYLRHELAPVVVHYADRYTTYGPFGAKEGMLRLLTLRSEHSGFTGFMPEAREHLIGRPGRNIRVDVDTTQTVPAGDTNAETVMSGTDGLEVIVIQMGPGAVFELPAATTPLGEYHQLLSGSQVVSGEQNAAPALGWYERAAAPTTLIAGAEGLHAIVMRFPDTSDNVMDAES